MSATTRCEYSELYTPEKLAELESQRDSINNAFVEYRVTNKLYDNQRVAAREIADAFNDPKVLNVMAVAPTQSGKTGIIFATIEELYKAGNVYEDYHIYVITGISSTAWVQQTLLDIPPFIKCNVYHLQNLKTLFVNDIQSKNNVLILIDEVQVAAKDKQTLLKSFHMAGLMNKTSMYRRNAKVVNITATPDGLIYGHKAWNEAAKQVFIEAGQGYTSCFDLLNSGRLLQANSNLSGWDGCMKEYTLVDEAINSILEIKKVIVPDKPSYHIIRTQLEPHQEQTMLNFKLVFIDNNPEYKCEFIQFDGEYLKLKQDITDINDILSVEPKVHTFIFIKEMLRCAKRIVKTHLGVLYERIPIWKVDDGCIIQGLLGRSTGYDDCGKHYCFPNLDTVYRYQQLLTSDFEATVEWNSKTSRFTKGKLIVNDSFSDGGFYDGTKQMKSDDDDDS